MIFNNKKAKENKYKFKSLKVYASEEWLAEGKKKYRQVFEKLETGYLYAELAFYNKDFDGTDWEINVKLLCYKVNRDGKKVLCDLHLNQKVYAEENITYIREGWGHEEFGYFWNKGEYAWEAFLDNELVGTTSFFVEDGGLVSPLYNPYFDILSLKLFEGSNHGAVANERVYLRQFHAEETRYIWVELKVDNMLNFDWQCELIFNFYNEIGQLKGTTTELRGINGNEDDVIFITGWGSDNKGTWYAGRYTLEIVFMDNIIAKVLFECSVSNIEGKPKIYLGDDLIQDESKDEEEELSADQINSKTTLETSVRELNQLIGLTDIKSKIEDYIKYLEFIQLRKEKGFDENEKPNLHAVLVGNPGTGKTTVAKILGQIYHHIGYLSKGNITEVGRAELIGQYIGQTAPKVKEMIDNARGGVLFIDEAYSLVRSEDDDKDYGQEVIEVLVKEMSDGPGDIAIFLAGYPEEMNVVLNSNPGLKSRFGTTFHFSDYLPQELLAIALSTAKKKEINFEEKAVSYLERKLINEFRTRDKSFGNARLVCTWIDELKMKMGLRIMQSPDPSTLSKQQLSTITKSDLETLFKVSDKSLPMLGIDEDDLKEQLVELDAMMGLQQVKNEIRESVKLVRFYSETQQDILGRFSLHAVFKGNPGTGKTSVARLLARIYKALGLLEKGHLVECSRKDLVAGFVGQTALKTQKVLERAKGGVLFIDEAYALNANDGVNQDFGKESIEVILKEMEDRRGEVAVIVAGYTQEIDSFLKMNPGLKSRFDKTFLFADFSANELLKIALDLFKKQKLTPNKNAIAFLKTFFENLSIGDKKHFGNARDVRKLVEQAVRFQHLRVSRLPVEKRTKQTLKSVLLADVQNINLSDTDNGKSIGFSQGSR